MEVSQYGLAQMLLAALICGLALGVIYDLLRLTRMCWGDELSPHAQYLRERLAVPPHLRWIRRKQARPRKAAFAASLKCLVLFLEDVFFCLLIGLSLVLLVYRANDGQFRISAAAVLLGGLALYLLTLGRLARSGLSVLVVIVRAVLLWTITLIFYPIALLARMLLRWTAPMRMGIKQKYGRFQHHWSERRQARRARRMHPEAKDPTVSAPINGKHYFSTGTRNRHGV